MISSVIKSATTPQCYSCDKEITESVKKCSRCKTAIYCGQDCQKNDWPTHKIKCIDTTTPYTEENVAIRYNLAGYAPHILNSNQLPKHLHHLKTDKYNHILQTQKAILKGSAHLNPETSIVVVCGAQYYEDKFVEPLPELLQRCKKMILLDVDPLTLEKLHALLGSSAKVSKVVLDLTCELKNLPAFSEASSKLSSQEFISNISAFLENATQNALKRSPGLPGVLDEATAADYVISSLVASQLSIRLKYALFSLYSKKFGTPVPLNFTAQEMDKFKHVLEQNLHALTIKHAEDLCHWAGPAGRVYFADTHKIHGCTLLANKTLDDLAKMLQKRNESHPLIKEEWHWIANPKDHYEVLSWLS